LRHLTHATDFLEVPRGLCPKCLAPRGDTGGCPRCGLVYERLDPGLLKPSEAQLAGWLTVIASWSDAAAHQRNGLAALERNELQPLLRMYRLHLLKNPDDAVASATLRHLEGLLTQRLLLMQQVETQANVERGEAREASRRRFSWLRLFKIDR
jgi:hypothetical protein